MNLDEARQTFIVECHELLQEMEHSLLRLEADAQDKDQINALFRAAHTIKGSAGLFGLDDIVHFTHLLENLLDRMRDGEIACDAHAVELLLECRDHVGALVGAAADGAPEPDPAMLDCARRLCAGLSAMLGRVAAAADAATAPAPAATKSRAAADGQSGADCWHLSLRFGTQVFRNGMDPLSFIRYLGTLGQIAHIATLHDRIPSLGAMDPESCYLGFEIRFRSEADKETIARVFEFVREDSTIKILPPRSKLCDYVDLIRSYSENEARLGTLLVTSGAITHAELAEGLQKQGCPSRLQAEGCKYRIASGDAGARDKGCLAEPNSGCAYRKLLGEILVEEGAVPQELVDTALDKQKQARERKTTDGQHIRIRAGKLDDLINLVGELVIAGASNALLAGRANYPMLKESASSVSRLVERIRNRALELRMVQIGETFNRFQRVVRDISKELGKDIGLVVEGADTELDKSVVEKIGDPLTHLVRNAMDHGIEPQALRVARGKPAKGSVRLAARHESGGIVIEVGDDGGGLDRDRILAKARERGLVAAGQDLSDRQVFSLIFEPGFSTAEQVTNLSGRGVGMDVVRSNIEALHGSVDIESRPGAGTTVRIRLPLTLAIIDGFLVKVGRAGYVVPLDMVVDCLELTEAHRLATRERNLIDLRGEPLPVLRLRDQFDIAGRPARRENIVVVHYAGQKAGLIVDELMGKLQAVIKPLGRIFRNVRGIGGSTILGSGDVALILDVQALVEQAIGGERHSAQSVLPTSGAVSGEGN